MAVLHTEQLGNARGRARSSAGDAAQRCPRPEQRAGRRKRDRSADPHQIGTGPLHAGEPIVMDIFPRSESTGYFGDLTRTEVIESVRQAITALPAHYREVARKAGKLEEGPKLDAMLDRHGTGRVQFRNTRVTVSGFPRLETARAVLMLASRCAGVWRFHLQLA